MELGKTNGKISIDNAKFYHRVDVDDDDVYTAKMPDNEEKIMKWVKMTGRNL